MFTTTLHFLATSVSCVAIMIILLSFKHANNLSRIFSPFVLSNDPVGSSASIILGFFNNNLIKAMRCCSPPLNVDILRFKSTFTFNSVNNIFLRFRFSAFEC